MTLTDTHCHLNFPDDFRDPDASIREAQGAGVTRLVLVGLDPETGRRALTIAERHEGVYAVVGRHPNYSQDYDPSELAEFRDMLAHQKCVALGEIGLDFHWEYATREQQERALLDQLDLAQELNKPVVFHCREAYPELLAILEKRPLMPYLFHCFSGDADDAKRAVKLGSWFGIDGPITYKNSGPFRELVKTLPADKMVLETDSPFMTPVPYRGKPNKPAYLPLINAALAETLEITPAECAELTNDNAQAFFEFK